MFVIADGKTRNRYSTENLKIKQLKHTIMDYGIRPLPYVEEVIKSTGLRVTFSYDDLVFVEHNAFLIRFNDEKPEQLFLHFNKECDEAEKPKLIRMLEGKAHSLEMQIIKSTDYSMEQIEGTEEFQVIFDS